MIWDWRRLNRCALCNIYLEIVHNKWRHGKKAKMYFFARIFKMVGVVCIIMTRFRHLLWKKVSPQRCFSFQITITNRKEKNSEFKEGKKLTKQTSQKTFVSLNSAKYTYSFLSNEYLYKRNLTPICNAFLGQMSLFFCWRGSTTMMRPSAEQI